MTGKRGIRYFILVLCIACSMQARATHIFGGEMLYQHLSSTKYVLSITLYGDCSASIFSTLYTAQPEVSISGDSSQYNATLHPLPGTGIEVSPICASMIAQTSCNGGILPGVKKFVYTDTLDLPPATDWRFEFTGALGSSGSAAHSSNITNIDKPGASGVYLLATLDNSDTPNSSPIYTTTPTPYYCLNILQQYNQGAIDGDNDSLVFELVAGTSDGVPLDYLPPYTADHPLAANDFTFSAINGQMSFTPDELQNSLVVNRITEYRNGKAVGSSMRNDIYSA